MRRSTILICLSILFLKSAWMSVCKAELGEGLVAHYAFNGDANDLSGNGNHGIVYGETVYTTDSWGNTNGALHFDGIDDYLLLPNEGNFDLNQFSIVVTARVKDYSRRNFLMSKGLFGNYTIEIMESGWPYYTHDVSMGNSTYPIGGVVPVNQYFHISVTYSQDGYKGYLNGSPTGLVSTMPPPLQNDYPLRIGAAGDSSIFDFYLGDIDDVRIYNRVLTSFELSEIANLFCLGGSISGVVTRKSDGQPISGLQVIAYDIVSENPIIHANTQSDGSYAIWCLPSGNYRVTASGSGTSYISEYYNNTTDLNSAEAVSVTVGQTTFGINFSLALGGTISGLVTRESDGQPISGVQVNASDIVTGAQINSGSTQADGSYVIRGLPSGNYRVQAQGSDYIREYYNNTTDFNSAEAVSVTAEQTTSGINFNLALGGSISGVVTRESDGQPLGNMNMAAFNYSSGSWVSIGITQEDGSYVFRGLLSGNYRVRASGWGTNYISEYYNNTTVWDLAEPVAVTQGQTTTGINFSLALEGSVSEMGDVNGDGAVDLIDAVMALQIMSGMNPQGVETGSDLNGDGKVGLEEMIYMLQKISNLR